MTKTQPSVTRRALLPVELRTERLILRPWRVTDAAALAPILAANVDHLTGWIPARIATPAPVEILASRLSEFATAFDSGREWRYAIFSADGELLGELSLFPRSDAGRVAFTDADRIELGYWLRRDATGNGYATEATRAAADLASALPGVNRLTIICDGRNEASAAVPRRLGFHLASRAADPSGRVLQIWELATA
jgi:ribosomal-protein-serine acetyltransferase